MVFLLKKKVIELFKDFEIIRFKEIEKDSLTRLGKMKHWHIFDMIAKKRYSKNKISKKSNGDNIFKIKGKLNKKEL